MVDALANGGRFAASDVAAKTGSSIEEAKRALRDLAALLGEEAGLEVSSDGELIYKVRENTTRGRSGGRTAAPSLRIATTSPPSADNPPKTSGSPTTTIHPPPPRPMV